jgi:glycosyltransferase involved in cell wall biosynthesis
MPLLSVIVPFYRDIASLEACLGSIRQSAFEDYELIVADDGSTDPAAASRVAGQYGAKVVRLQTNSGPAAARNRASEIAAGEILVFFDADVTAHKDTLGRFAEAFRADSTLDALLGSYDMRPKVHGLVAIFRNLLHAHVHHRSAGEVSTFWAGCGAVRRARFAALHGFDESYRQPSIEDVELGWRLHDAGAKLRLDPTIQVSHHKEWTLRSMIFTDIFQRALPWTLLMRRYGLPRNLNFRWQDRLSVACAGLLPVLLVLAWVARGMWWIPAVAGTVAIGWLQWPVYRFLWKQRGLPFAMACYPLLLVHYWSSACGFALGLASSVWKRALA